MIKFLNKLNFLLGIILVLVFLFPGSIAKNISQRFMRLLNNIFAYIDWTGFSGGYLGMFYESLIVEGIGSAVYCSVIILLPMFLNKRYFKNVNINWLPAIFIVFLFFTLPTLIVIYMFFSKVLGTADWIDTITYVVAVLGHSFGYISIIIVALFYSETQNKYVKMILNKFGVN